MSTKKEMQVDTINAWADFIEENMQIIYEKKHLLNQKVDAKQSCVKGLRELASLLERNET